MTMCTLRGSVDVLKALGHPVRLRILCLLRKGELCVCQVTEILGLAPSTISEHLSLLRRAGFIEERKDGKWVFYAQSEDPDLRPLCEALWPLVDGDAVLKADERHCAKVRKMSLATLCKVGSGALKFRLPASVGTLAQPAMDSAAPGSKKRIGAAK
jgi:ArsR family transcriptional regulator, arsenate/arsenite/antimonite-responsive transcriptional repressor